MICDCCKKRFKKSEGGLFYDEMSWFCISCTKKALEEDERVRKELQQKRNDMLLKLGTMRKVPEEYLERNRTTTKRKK